MSIGLKKSLKYGLTLLIAAVLLSACAAGTSEYAESQAGFFSGVWHGWIAPFALIWHIFNDEVRIYETNNDGIWYDVGFYIAVISGFGSIGLSRGRNKSSKGRATRTKSD